MRPLVEPKIPHTKVMPTDRSSTECWGTSSLIGYSGYHKNNYTLQKPHWSDVFKINFVNIPLSNYSSCFN